MVDTINLTMVKFTHHSNHRSTPKSFNTGLQPSTLARSWHQGSAAEVADAMGSTASAGSGPVFQKSHAYVVHSTSAESPRANSTSGHGRCSARHPCRNQPPKGVHGQKGEANAAKSKNGNAGWNPGTAHPEHIGAKPERLAPGCCGLNGFRRARGLSAVPHLHFPWHARRGIGSFFTVCANGWPRPPPKVLT